MEYKSLEESTRASNQAWIEGKIEMLHKTLFVSRMLVDSMKTILDRPEDLTVFKGNIQRIVNNTDDIISKFEKVESELGYNKLIESVEKGELIDG